MIKFLKNLLKNFSLFVAKGNKFFIVLNYHRIGKVDLNNPFHRLHTVPLSTFKIQVIICSMIGKFVSLEDAINCKLSSKLSFCITFDDVSSSITNAIKWLEKKEIPFAICPCQKITEDGLGWRDKVYFIEKFLDKKDINSFIREKFPTVNFGDKISFYKLSKNIKFDQLKMINEVVNPLFELNVVNKFKTSEKNYFSEMDIVNFKNEFRYMEIVNHSLSHANLADFNSNQLNEEIESCDNFLKNITGKKPKFFAVPFGNFDPNFCLGLNEVARLNKKKGILWVNNRLNLDIGNKPNKLKQISRFHTSNSVLGLFKQIFLSIFKDNFTEHISSNNNSTGDLINSSIKFNPDIKKILAFEDLSRPTKDYSGNLDYLKNTYILNPFLNGKNHTIAETQNNNIVAIGQNLIMPFHGLENINEINLFGNYRALRGISKMSLAILIQATKECELSISYKPSKLAEPILKKLNWYPLKLKKFIYNLNEVSSHKINPKLIIEKDIKKNYEIEKYNFFKENEIQLKLSGKLLEWRVQNYSLANSVYFYLDEGKSNTAFVICQYNKKEILLLDQRFSIPEALTNILRQIIQWAKVQNLSKLIVETSCELTQEILGKTFPEAKIKYDLCYLYQHKNIENLKKKKVIITPLSSDILLR